MPDLSAWFDQISATSPLAFALVALAGLTMGVAPSSLPLYSVVVGYAGAPAITDRSGTASGKGRGLKWSAGFVLGMATVDAAIGALFGFLGYGIIRTLSGFQALTNFMIAALLTLFGLALLRKIRIRNPLLRPKVRKADSFPAAYALGIPFGLSTCPTCTPMILPILGAAAATGVPWLGGLLLLIFGLARGLPLLLAGTMAGMLTGVRRITPWIPTLEKACGVLLFAAAFYFLYQSAVFLGLVPPLTYLL